MALLKRLQEFLDANRVEYTHTVHRLAYTAREVAAAEHMPARQFAKTLIVAADGGFHMFVVPGSRMLDVVDLRFVLDAPHARLATELELARLFPDCELGAMPPFGNLYGMPVYLDVALNAAAEIGFNGGTHRDVVHMQLADYKRLVQPKPVSIARESLVHSAG